MPKSRFRKSFGAGDAAHEQHDGGGVEEGTSGGDGGLEVLGEPPVAADPGEEALDDPAPWLYREPNLIRVLAHDLDGNHRGLGDPFAGVSAVGEDPLDEGKRAARHV